VELPTSLQQSSGYTPLLLWIRVPPWTSPVGGEASQACVSLDFWKNLKLKKKKISVVNINTKIKIFILS
jgi:hypothetical protein